MRDGPGVTNASGQTTVDIVATNLNGVGEAGSGECTFETADEYFDYYRDYHAFWKLYGIALPDGVLKKLYFENALKIIPGLSRTGFPQ